MVMEYVSGGELFDYILKHGKVSIHVPSRIKISYDAHDPRWFSAYKFSSFSHKIYCSIVLLMTGAKTRVLVKCQQPTKKPATLRSEQSAFGGKSVK